MNEARLYEIIVAPVLTEQVRQWDDATGRISAVDSVDLRPRVSGYVQRVAYDEGAEVARGDLLFVIDQRPYRAALDQAEATLAMAGDVSLGVAPHLERAAVFGAGEPERVFGMCGRLRPVDVGAAVSCVAGAVPPGTPADEEHLS